MPDARPDDEQCRRSMFGILCALLAIAVSLLWLLNLSAGLIEIPDNLPFVGNIDEAFAAWTIIACLRYLGIDIFRFLPMGNRSQNNPIEDAE